MANNETTTKFKVDISELKKAMQDAKRSISVANSEFKAVSSTMDDWSKTTEGVSAKLNQLDSNLKSQKTILSSLEAQYEAVVAEQGEGSAAADRLRISINNQKAVVNKTEREISKYEQTLEDIAKAEAEGADSSEDMADALKDTADAAEEAGEGFTVFKGAVATFAGNVLTSLVSGLKDAVGSLMGLAEETREYRTELAKLETAAEEAGGSTDYIKEKWQDLGSVLGDEGAVTEGLNNLLAAGFTTQEQMDTITSHLEGAALKWKDTLKFEGLADGLQETLATSAAVGSFGEMLERSGVNLETFNAGLANCTTEADKQNYILSELSKLGLNDISSAYRKNNEDLISANKANSEYTDTLAEMGARIEPVTTTLKSGFTDLLNTLLAMVGEVDMEAFTAKIEEGFAVIKDVLLPAVKEGFQWILDNKDLLVAGLAAIAGGFVAFNVANMIMGVVTAFKAFKAANEGATVAQWLLNAAMNANPIVLVVSLIAAIVTALVTFIATNEDAQAKLKEVWQTIKDFVGKAIDSICKFFTETVPKALDSMLKFFSELPGKIWNFLVKVITKIIEWRINMIKKAAEIGLAFVTKVVEFAKQLPGKIYSAIQGAISKVKSWGSSLATTAKNSIRDMVTKAVSAAKDLPNKFKEIGKNIIEGIKNGIGDAIGGLYSNIKEKLSGLVDKAKNALGINSPSKVFADEVGKWIPEGMAVGIDKNAKSALSSVRDMALSTVSGAKSGLSSASTTLGASGTRGGVVNNFTQIINSPKELSRLDIYRQSKNLLGYAGGV